MTDKLKSDDSDESNGKLAGGEAGDGFSWTFPTMIYGDLPISRKSVSGIALRMRSSAHESLALKWNRSEFVRDLKTTTEWWETKCTGEPYNEYEDYFLVSNTSLDERLRVPGYTNSGAACAALNGHYGTVSLQYCDTNSEWDFYSTVNHYLFSIPDEKLARRIADLINDGVRRRGSGD